jgi:hypothetical protein
MHLTLCASGATLTSKSIKAGRILTPSTGMNTHTERSMEVQPEHMAMPDQK